MPRSSDRSASRFAPRHVLLAVVGLVVVVLALVTGFLQDVVVHAFAWPALLGGWVAAEVGATPGGAVHTAARWVLEVPWLLVLLSVAGSIGRQGWQEHGAARAHRGFWSEHGDEITELEARIDEAPGVIDVLEAESARISATLEALGADAWAAGAVVTRTAARLVVERTGEGPDGATLQDVEAGEVSVRARDVAFHGETSAVQWTHDGVRRRREPTRLLLGVTGGAEVVGIPCGVQASPLALDHLEVVLSLAASEIDTFGARQQLFALTHRAAADVDRVLDRGEADLARLADLEALRPGAGTAGADDAATDPGVVWGRGAERAVRRCWPEVQTLCAPDETVEYVLRVKRRRPNIDLVVVTDQRVIGLSRSDVESGPVVQVRRDDVENVELNGVLHRLTLRLSDNRALDLGVLGHTDDEIPALFHLRRVETEVLA